LPGVFCHAQKELAFVIFHLQKKDLPGWLVIHKKTCLGDWSYTKKTCLGDLLYTKKTCLGCFVIHKEKDLPGCFVVHKKTCLGDLSYTRKTPGWFVIHQKRTCLGCFVMHIKNLLLWFELIPVNMKMHAASNKAKVLVQITQASFFAYDKLPRQDLFCVW
jgi:hypothetical protein